jgi:hypothetical protein
MMNGAMRAGGPNAPQGVWVWEIVIPSVKSG